MAQQKTKRVFCNCGAILKINLLKLRDAHSLNCFACGQKLTTQNSDIPDHVEKMVDVKYNLSEKDLPFRTLAYFAYNKNYAERNTTLDKYNILRY